MPKVHVVEKARKDYPAQGIKKGEKYYWWKFRFRNPIKSKTYPKRSQLTQSEFLGWLYDIQDTWQWSSEADDLEGQRDELVSEINNMKEELEDRLENMPDQLKDADSGSILQERIDALEQWASDLEGVDCDIERFLPDNFEELSEEEKEEEQQAATEALIEELSGCECSL